MPQTISEFSSKDWISLDERVTVYEKMMGDTSCSQEWK